MIFGKRIRGQVVGKLATGCSEVCQTTLCRVGGRTLRGFLAGLWGLYLGLLKGHIEEFAKALLISFGIDCETQDVAGGGYGPADRWA